MCIRPSTVPIREAEGAIDQTNAAMTKLVIIRTVSANGRTILHDYLQNVDEVDPGAGGHRIREK
jgi:hypothetical protein